MTRDDAIQDTYKSFRSCEPYDGYSNKELLDVAANNIDLFIALGMLKLEEPKSAREKFKDAMSSYGYLEWQSSFKAALMAFDASQK